MYIYIYTHIYILYCHSREDIIWSVQTIPPQMVIVIEKHVLSTSGLLCCENVKYTYAYTYSYLYAYVFTYLYAYVYVYAYIYIYTCIYVCM